MAAATLDQISQHLKATGTQNGVVEALLGQLHQTVPAPGLLQHPALMSDAITFGGYEVRFFVGDFYRSKELPSDATGFLDVVPYRFHIAEVAQHFHLPFKFTAWGFSLFRGGA